MAQINKNTRPVIELDFDSIKADIIEFIKTNPTFSDYVFEGSALNALTDILAYNTFNNAYYANMLHGENFLDSAQKRQSVVSISKHLGYTPRSAICSTGFVSMVVNTASAVYPPYSLSRGDVFFATNDLGSYSFSVVDTSVASISGNVHTFSSVRLVEGTRVRNSFIVDTTTNLRSMFTIPNKDVDITTLKVYVRDSINAVNKTEFSPVTDVYALVPDSKAYFVQESYDGHFQIFFGNDTLGTQPVNGNVIDIDYFVSTNYSNSDGCSGFVFDGSFPSALSSTVTTLHSSFGGSEKEETESIKLNAVKANMAKNRIVTVNDYSLEITKKFPYIKSVAVWGGEDNVPPVYGKVFISAQTVEGYTLSDAVKREVIVPEIRKTSMMTIIPEVIDPYYTMMEFVSRVKYNSAKTTSSKDTVSALVSGTVSAYMNAISRFNGDYLEAELIGEIMRVDPGVISVDLVKKYGLDTSPALNSGTRVQFNLNNPVVPGTLTSNNFRVTLATGVFDVHLKDLNGSIGLYDSSGALVQTIGTIDTAMGKLDFVLTVSDYLTSSRTIEVRMSPENDDIVVKRNQILSLNRTKSYANQVLIENYAAK